MESETPGIAHLLMSAAALDEDVELVPPTLGFLAGSFTRAGTPGPEEVSAQPNVFLLCTPTTLFLAPGPVFLGMADLLLGVTEDVICKKRTRVS